VENNELLQAIYNDLQGVKQDVSSLKQDVSGLKQNVSGLKQDVSGLKQDISGLKVGQAALQQDTKSIKLTLENITNKNIQIMMEGHSLNVEKLAKLDSIGKTVEETKENVDVMFKVIQEHSGDIKELKLAK